MLFKFRFLVAVVVISKHPTNFFVYQTSLLLQNEPPTPAAPPAASPPAAAPATAAADAATTAAADGAAAATTAAADGGARGCRGGGGAIRPAVRGHNDAPDPGAPSGHVRGCGIETLASERLLPTAKGQGAFVEGAGPMEEVRRQSCP